MNQIEEGAGPPIQDPVAAATLAERDRCARICRDYLNYFRKRIETPEDDDDSERCQVRLELAESIINSILNPTRGQ